MKHFSQEFLNFFIELAPNNNKDWFDANRSRYEKFVRDPFKDFVQHVIDTLAKSNPDSKDVLAKDCGWWAKSCSGTPASFDRSMSS